jgi:redox-sensitive bicupin YhaK (pirin superfamily)
MLTVRRADDRGHADHGWLVSRHTFSFAGYRDPEQMGYSVLRVINDDRVAPGGGFATHGHSDMEIVSYVLAGALEHEDSMGNGSVIRPGDVQRMSAGLGVTHSENNASRSEEVHFLQIWLLPNRTGIEPGYAQKHFPLETRRGRLLPLVTPDGRDGSLDAHSDALLYGALLGDGDAVVHRLAPGRRAYLHVARGEVAVDGVPLADGDGARVEGVATLRIEGRREADVLLFDLP